MQIKAVGDKVTITLGVESVVGPDRVELTIEDAEQLLNSKILKEAIFQAKRNGLEARNKRIAELKVELKRLEDMNSSLEKPFQLQ